MWCVARRASTWAKRVRTGPCLGLIGKKGSVNAPTRWRSAGIIASPFGLPPVAALEDQPVRLRLGVNPGDVGLAVHLDRLPHALIPTRMTLKAVGQLEAVDLVELAVDRVNLGLEQDDRERGHRHRELVEGAAAADLTN